MPEHRRKFDWLNGTTKISGAVIASAAVIALCWKLLATPIIQTQIDCSTKPIIEVLEYQTYLMMSNLTDEQIKKADQSYISAQKTKVRLR
jgi:hypothetical protein